VILSYKLPTFQHVYIEARINGAWRPYDPTPEEAVPGWESRGLVRGTFPIFDAGSAADPSNLAGLKTAGISAGVGALQGAPGGPIGAAIGGAIGFLSGLMGGGTPKQSAQMIEVGRQFDQADKELATYARTLGAKQSITAAEYKTFMDGLATLADVASEYGPQIPYVAKQWAMEQGNYAGWPALLEAKVTGGAKAIAAAVAGGGTAAAVAAGDGLGVGTILLIAGGGLLAFKVLTGGRK
jgi:hypothetical protein